MKIYLAGPMTGYPDYNFPAFDHAAAYLRNEGHEVFSPADADRERYGTMEQIKKKANYRECLGVDLNWILTNAECIAMLPGWEKSKGVAAEHALSRALGIGVILLIPSRVGDGYDIQLLEGKYIPVQIPETLVITNTPRPGDTPEQLRARARGAEGVLDPNAPTKSTRDRPLEDKRHFPGGMIKMGEKPTNPKDMQGINKAPMSCVPVPVLQEVALGMLEGACKYGRHNYRVIGVRGSIYYDATMRHLMSWWEGQDYDTDSKVGLHHVSKAIASLTVLRDSMIQGKFTDDRPPKAPANWEESMNTRAKALMGAFPDPVPPYTEKPIPGR